jgi:glucosamine-phosphate N-acetyltransferase
MNINFSTLYDFTTTNFSNISKINNSYQQLMSQLSDSPKLSDGDFFIKLAEINKINGLIFILYIGSIDDQEANDFNDNFKIIASGTILIEPKIIHNSSVGHIEDIVVDSNFRGKGLANKILTKIKTYAFNEKNVYKIILDCSPELEPVYQKNEFIKKGIQMALYK